MNTRLLQKYLLHLCFCVVACAYAALSLAAESADPVHAALKGRWEGRLNGAFRSQDVSWHFETDDEGELRGYMGPANAGMPAQMMENLVVAAGSISFTLASQHAAFTGTISPDGIAGSWQQGRALPLQMRKKDFVFPLSAELRAALVGNWEMDDGGTVTVEFSEGQNGSIAGFLSVPVSEVHDAPLVDIFVTSEGFAQFATDIGRRFTGRLANGVLVGEYFNDSQRYRSTFKRNDDQREQYDLGLTGEARNRLLGRWQGEVLGDDVVLEITGAADNQTHGELVFDEGPQRRDTLLELKVEGGNLSYTSLTGRTFTGSFNDKGFAGDYFNNGRAFGVQFTRVAE